MRRPAPRCCSARAAAAGRGIDLEQRSVRGRDGHDRRAPGRATSALPRCAAAPWSGEHTVIFAGPAERIELVHKAEDRMIFARGALKAAQWGGGNRRGSTRWLDVLGLAILKRQIKD